MPHTDVSPYVSDRKKQTITLHGQTCFPADLPALQKEYPPEKYPFHNELYRFLSEWFDESPFLTVHTSGSTGAPKAWNVRKEQMIESARMTCRYLKLKPGDKALLCMPLRYIAGKMMIVRALTAGLDIWLEPPSAHPLARPSVPFRFAAMIPLQIYETLRVPEEKKRLAAIDKLIIGGGAIDADLEKELKTFPHAVYSTYGMTETLSHIALRRLNGEHASPYYIPFPTVSLSLSEENTLIIDAPAVCDHPLHTNDIAELLPDGRFTVIGRKDNIINSGGLKIQLEQVEETLRQIISVDFAATAVPHPKFGEAMVLLVTPASSYIDSEPGTTDNNHIENLKTRINQRLEKHHRPKYIVPVKAIPLTGSGKIDRAACRKLATDKILKTT